MCFRKGLLFTIPEGVEHIDDSLSELPETSTPSSGSRYIVLSTKSARDYNEKIEEMRRIDVLKLCFKLINPKSKEAITRNVLKDWLRKAESRAKDGVVVRH